MSRVEQLKNYFREALNDITVIEPLIEKVVMLEEDLAELEKLPRVIVNRNNPQLVKEPPHFKMWKEKFQQYTNSVRILQSFVRSNDENEAESPLEKYIKNLGNRK